MGSFKMDVSEYGRFRNLGCEGDKRGQSSLLKKRLKDGSGKLRCLGG